MGARVLLWCGSSRDRRHLSRVEAYYVAGGAIATHPTPPTPLPCAQSFYDQDLLAGVAPSAAHLMLGGETVRPLPLADRRIHCLPCRIRPCSLFSSLQEMWGETADGERPFRAAIPRCDSTFQPWPLLQEATSSRRSFPAPLPPLSASGATTLSRTLVLRASPTASRPSAASSSSAASPPRLSRTPLRAARRAAPDHASRSSSATLPSQPGVASTTVVAVPVALLQP